MIKKILLSLPKDSSYYSGMTRALHYLDMEVDFFDFRKFNTKERLTLLLKKDRVQAEKMLNRRLIKTCTQFRPDALLVMKGETIRPETIREVNTLGISTINWFPDHVNSLELAYNLSGAYKLFFHFDPYALSELKKRGRKSLHYLPFAADILPTDTPPKTGKKYKVSFIGNFNSRRQTSLEKISDLGLHVWGDQRWASSTLVKRYEGPLPNKSVLETLSNSEIGINIQHDYPCDGAVLRVFEVLNSHSLLLSEDRKSLHRLFRVGKEIEIFNNLNQLREKTTYFLNHSKERESIAQAGYASVSKKHTYVSRIKEMLSFM